MSWPWLRTPTATRLIARLMPDDPAAKDGPRRCCAGFAIVTDCDGETDSLYCGICDRRWSQPCAVGDFVPAVEA